VFSIDYLKDFMKNVNLFEDMIKAIDFKQITQMLENLNISLALDIKIKNNAVYIKISKRD